MLPSVSFADSSPQRGAPFGRATGPLKGNAFPAGRGRCRRRRRMRWEKPPLFEGRWPEGPEGSRGARRPHPPPFGGHLPHKWGRLFALQITGLLRMQDRPPSKGNAFPAGRGRCRRRRRMRWEQPPLSEGRWPRGPEGSWGADSLLPSVSFADSSPQRGAPFRCTKRPPLISKTARAFACAVFRFIFSWLRRSGPARA